MSRCHSGLIWTWLSSWPSIEVGIRMQHSSEPISAKCKSLFTKNMHRFVFDFIPKRNSVIGGSQSFEMWTGRSPYGSQTPPCLFGTLESPFLLARPVNKGMVRQIVNLVKTSLLGLGGFLEWKQFFCTSDVMTLKVKSLWIHACICSTTFCSPSSWPTTVCTLNKAIEIWSK